MKALNNKGETLVEIIIGVAVLAIATIALVQGFVSTANIVNRALLYKNSSSAASSTVELQEVQTSPDTLVDIQLKRDDGSLNVTGSKKSGAPINFTVNGEFIAGKDDGKLDLTYREFLPGTYDFNVPAVDTD